MFFREITSYILVPLFLVLALLVTISHFTYEFSKWMMDSFVHWNDFVLLKKQQGGGE